MKKIKNKLQQMIKNIKTFFINKLCVSLRTNDNTQKNYLHNNEKKQNLYKLKHKFMLKKIKRYLGFQDFLDYDSLKEILSKEDN